MSAREAIFKNQIQTILNRRKRRRVDDPLLICAAVLVPLLLKDREWHVVVTQRTQTVEHHPGQISFPGGACEPEDRSLQETALRETCEEIGIPPGAVEVLGALDDLHTVTRFVVTPFVGVIPHPLVYKLNPHEVEDVVEVPLSYLRDPAHLRIEQREYEGQVHDVYRWDYGAYAIWGATARILKGFLDLIPDRAHSYS
jgi:8-oxo-dGTP pyrophosphatase MutT (NUDIX family)